MDRLKFAFLSPDICREVAAKLNEVQGFSTGALAYLLYTADFLLTHFPYSGTQSKLCHAPDSSTASSLLTQHLRGPGATLNVQVNQFFVYLQ